MDDRFLLSTYRLQLNREFPFAALQSRLEYLEGLGITHLYSSPITKARTGSLHGYDVTDPGELNPELGDRASLERIVQWLHAHGMGYLLDIVPNHMATGAENPYLWDVLMYGRSSPYASWFDIDWRAIERSDRPQIIIPVLGTTLKQARASRQVNAVYDGERFLISYGTTNFPASPTSLPVIVGGFLKHYRTMRPGAGESVQQLESEARPLMALTHTTSYSPMTAERRDMIAAHIARFAATLRDVPDALEVLQRFLRDLEASPDGSRVFEELLEAQAYRLAYWRLTRFATSYRRFFDINDLIALRMEDEEVFAASHRFVLDLVNNGMVDGLRIDHIDGLQEPVVYLRRLRAALETEAGRGAPIVVEKILARGEALRTEWPADGTTGYEFATQVDRAFLAPRGFRRIDSFYRKRCRMPGGFKRVARLSKRYVLQTVLLPDVQRLAERLSRLRRDLGGSPLPLSALRAAIIETIAALPIYRTYISRQTLEFSDADRTWLEETLARVRERARGKQEALDLVADCLLAPWVDPYHYSDWYKKLDFIVRFQQISAAACAKGVEDTAFYRYGPLLAQNEVGGEPRLVRDDAVRVFHHENMVRAERWPRTLLAVTTHDTKRSADTRSRLCVLTERASEWIEAVEAWWELNSHAVQTVHDRPVPDRNLEYMLYQSMIGIWPAAGPVAPPLTERIDAAFRERIEAFALKSIREAKLNSSWHNPDEQYEQAVLTWLRSVLDAKNGAFLESVDQFVSSIAVAGYLTALSRTAIHLTAPGVPDIYQGDELWNFTLVDPDNRRPVDFDRRAQLLSSFTEPPTCEGPLAERLHDGRVKLYVIQRLLCLRRELPELFLNGSYEPLEIAGRRADHIVAFLRRSAAGTVITIVPRLWGTLKLGQLDAAVWDNTSVVIPDGVAMKLSCAFTGSECAISENRLPVGAVLARFPVTVLHHRS